MHPIIRKTPSGLSLSYYFQPLLFSSHVIAFLSMTSPTNHRRSGQ